MGVSCAAVPLYRLYGQTTGPGESAVAGHASDQTGNMVPVKDRITEVTFNADVHASLQWNFRPQQTEIYVVPGETALAFYKAKTPTDKPVNGIPTYNVAPFEAGQYFDKMQCLLDMPVIFYIDPEFAEDPRMVNVDLIILSYTGFFFFFFFPVRGFLTVVTCPVVEHTLRTCRLSGHGSRAQPLRGMWDLPGQGHEPVSPTSAGGL
uniref:Cytochrome c oxidase assembly protein COX11, mitochondrial n=1 Tax=Phocoena sinus TaxID=42100 RepID=A0A8C9E3H6_PHOSS